VERFKKHLPKHDVAVLGHGDFDRSRIRYVATWGPKPGSLSDLPALEAIFSLGAGVDHLMSYQGLPDAPIVRVAQDDLTHRMSEYVVLHCLMHLRDQRRFDAAQRAKQWDQERSPPIASEVRVGVMGSGVLGQDAATWPHGAAARRSATATGSTPAMMALQSSWPARTFS
jgi:glyoxylate/hydroxypyruvate reductase A